MIITKEFVHALHHTGLLCDTGLEYILTNDYIGTTRTQFIDKIKAHIDDKGCPVDYLPWSINTLVKHPLIKHHPDFRPTGKFRVPGLTETFYDIDRARLALQTLKDLNPTTSYLYCIEEETIDTSDPTDPQTSWRCYH